MKQLIVAIFLLLVFFSTNAQPDRWQQHIKYVINVDMNVTTNRFTGTEKIDYWNNSPDTLNRLFFHLYWNAFQPNSMKSEELEEVFLIVQENDDDGKHRKLFMSHKNTEGVQ